MDLSWYVENYHDIYAHDECMQTSEHRTDEYDSSMSPCVLQLDVFKSLILLSLTQKHILPHFQKNKETLYHVFLLLI